VSPLARQDCSLYLDFYSIGMTHHFNNELLRWQQAAGRRHALDGLPPHPGQTFRTLCGVDVTPERSDIVLLGARCIDPTCDNCERVWRHRIGMGISDGAA